MHGRVAERAAGARGGVAHGRLAADPEPRHDRRQPRHRLTRGRRDPAAPRRRTPRSTSRACAASGGCRSSTSSSGVKKNVLEPDELVVSVRVAAEPAPADVHEGRAAERDGDLRLLAGARGRPRARRAAGGLRLCRSDGAPRHGAARRGRRLPGARRLEREPDRRRPRHGRLPPPRARACSRAVRSRGAWREDRAHRQRRAPRGRRLGRREPPLHAARAARPARLEERVRAGRVRVVLGAARRRPRLLLPRPRRAGTRA